MKEEKELLYQLAIRQIPGVGGVMARRLIAYCGGVEQVFREREGFLRKIPGIGVRTARTIRAGDYFRRAEQEILFMQKQGIRPLYFLDEEYPYRLKQCEDGPILLFVKGSADLNHPRVVAVVGTRSMTAYGMEQCERLLHDLAGYGVMVVSGLAYGVDACAHRNALRRGLPTVGVLAHGLDRVYPSLHHKLAAEMMDKGALVTDFLSGTRPERENFPSRNRIIAGLCDAVVVVEAAVTGGALITAGIANSYNRDVFSIPGRINDRYSQGCNKLIRINQAHLLESAADMQYIMNWEPAEEASGDGQGSLFVQLTAEEKHLAAFLAERPGAGIDQIVAATGYNLGKTTSLLLGLEFKGVVQTLPGKHFRLSAQVG